MNTHTHPHIAGGDHISANPCMMRSECRGKNKRKCMFLDEEHHQPRNHTTFVNPIIPLSSNPIFVNQLGINQFPHFPLFPSFPSFPSFHIFHDFPLFPYVSSFPTIPIKIHRFLNISINSLSLQIRTFTNKN